MRSATIIALALVPALAAALPARAADPVPEIERPAAMPQAVGAAHTLRTIPEACTRVEGVFTGDAAEPYRFAVVRTSPNCQPRARFVDAATAHPDLAAGWILNDLIRVPSAACPDRQAVVRVWRRPAEDAAPPDLDAQGRSRIYLQESRQAAASGATARKVPMFAAAMTVEGEGCP